MFKSIPFILLCSFLNLNSWAMDVVPNDIKAGDRYVRVSLFENKSRITFEDCIFGLEEKTCSFIGKKEGYKKEVLIEQKIIEKLHIGYAIGADVAIVAGAIYLSGITAYGASIYILYGEGWGFLTYMTTRMAAMTGGVTALATTAVIDELNPLTQYLQTTTLADEVLNDKTVVKDGIQNIEIFITHLTAVLSNIDSN